MGNRTDIQIEGRTCHLLWQGEGGPTVWWPFVSEHGDDPEDMFGRVAHIVGCHPFALAAFEVPDWNHELSPWELGDDERPGYFSDESFDGGGETTYTWLQTALTEVGRLLPGVSRHYVAGYSLGGLFALWALLASGGSESGEGDTGGTPLFCGAASCSGSLWYPGWFEFVEQHAFPQSSIIYLSLGDAEERASNPVVCRIAECTRRFDEFLEATPDVTEHVLTWNKGGHFKKASQRMAVGIAWLVQHA